MIEGATNLAIVPLSEAEAEENNGSENEGSAEDRTNHYSSNLATRKTMSRSSCGRGVTTSCRWDTGGCRGRE